MSTPQQRRDTKAQRRLEGVCTECKADAETGRTMCLKHLKLWRQRARDRYKDRRAKGLCASCGAPAAGKVRCPGCHAVMHAAMHAAIKSWRARKRAPAAVSAAGPGMCTGCGQNAPMSGAPICWCCSQKAVG